MYKYTAHKSVLNKYASIKKNSKRPWDDHYFLASRICGTAGAYFACGNFWRNYFNICFYSKTKRNTVPVNGVLIPVEWFTEEQV